jgi:putative sporulation protein YtaF
VANISLILFALAVSLDGFGAGLAYGMRGIVIPLHSLLAISATSSLAIAVSMICGNFIAGFIPVSVAEIIGAVILGMMGLYMLVQVWVNGGAKKSEQVPGSEEMLVHFRIPTLGILVQVLREPSKADLDHSGVLSVREAFLLGFALAMDAIGAGFALAVAGFPPLWTALYVGVCKFLLVMAAVRIGKFSSNNWFGKKFSFIPGLILLMISISKFR